MIKPKIPLTKSGQLGIQLVVLDEKGQHVYFNNSFNWSNFSGSNREVGIKMFGEILVKHLLHEVEIIPHKHCNTCRCE